VSDGALQTSGDHSVGGAADGARNGVTPPSQPGGWTGFLDDVIVELGYADKETVEWAVEQGRHLGQAVGAVLLESRVLDDGQLSRAVAELHGLDHVDLDAFDVDLDVARLITRTAARRYRAVPIAFDPDGSLIVALADPVDPLAVSDIAVMTRSEVRPMVASESSIDAVIEHLKDAPAVPPPRDRDASGAAQRGQGPWGEETPRQQPPSDDQAAAPRDYGTTFDQAERIPEPTGTGSPAPATPEAPEPPNPEPPEPAPPRPEPDDSPPPRPDPPPAAEARALDGGEAPEELVQAQAALAALAERLSSYEPRSRELAAGRDALEREIESGAEERERLREELEAADLRAKAANASLVELRTERDREREEQAELVRVLRAKLDDAKDANRQLEERLATVLAATAEIRSAVEKLTSTD
jgi:hypothetical protein